MFFIFANNRGYGRADLHGINTKAASINLCRCLHFIHEELLLLTVMSLTINLMKL